MHGKAQSDQEVTTMPNRLNANEAAAKLISRGTAAVGDYVKGVNSVSVSPTALAAQNLEKAKMAYNESIDSGRMKRKLEAVTLEGWKSQTAQLGQQRYAPGLSASKAKCEKFFGAFLPVAYAVSDEVAKMPNVTIEDSIARATMAIRRLHEFKNQ